MTAPAVTIADALAFAQRVVRELLPIHPRPCANVEAYVWSDESDLCPVQFCASFYGFDRLAKAEAESEDARGDSEGGAMTLERLCGPAVHVCWTQDEAPEAKRELVVLVRADDLAALEARFLSAKEPSNAR